MEVRCPTCRKRGEWLSGAFGPFCSQRCRLIDLGQWLQEEHAISAPLQPHHFQEEEEKSNSELGNKDSWSHPNP